MPIKLGCRKVTTINVACTTNLQQSRTGVFSSCLGVNGSRLVRDTLLRQEFIEAILVRGGRCFNVLPILGVEGWNLTGYGEAGSRSDEEIQQVALGLSRIVARSEVTGARRCSVRRRCWNQEYCCGFVLLLAGFLMHEFKLLLCRTVQVRS